MKRASGQRFVKGAKKQASIAPEPGRGKASPKRACNLTMKKFLGKPNKTNFAAFQRAHNTLLRINLPQARAMRLRLMQEMKRLGLNENNFK